MPHSPSRGLRTPCHASYHPSCTTHGKGHSDHRKINQGDRATSNGREEHGQFMRKTQPTEQSRRVSPNTSSEDQGAHSQPTLQHQVPLFPGHTGNLSLLTCNLQLLLTDARLVILESGGQVPSPVITQLTPFSPPESSMTLTFSDIGEQWEDLGHPSGFLCHHRNYHQFWRSRGLCVMRTDPRPEHGRGRPWVGGPLI